MNQDAFLWGFTRGLQREMRKEANTSPVMTALRRRELAALGEKIWRTIRSQRNPGALLGNHLLPGGHQIEALQNLIGSYAKNYRGMNAASRVDYKRLFQKQLGDAYADIGGYAEPKLRFAQRTFPGLAGGAAGAGVGVLGGGIAGTLGGQNDMRQRMRESSLWDRFKFLVDPSQLPTRRPRQILEQSSNPVTQ